MTITTTSSTASIYALDIATQAVNVDATWSSLTVPTALATFMN